jgi:hypothetical protein
MAEDEDPRIAAVLAKLAGQDAAAAEDARAALEWVAGDQGLAVITQQRIQNFCWYDLPVRAIQRQMGIGQPKAQSCKSISGNYRRPCRDYCRRSVTIPHQKQTAFSASLASITARSRATSSR